MITKNFALSIGSKSALILLSNLEDGVFHLTSMPEADVVWTFRILFQLRNDPLPASDEEAWARCQTFLGGLFQSKETMRNAYAAAELLKVFAEQLVFSDENIDQVELLVKGNEGKLDPAIYSDSSALVGILMFPLKDACSYCGLLPEKVENWRRYQRLLHKKRLLQGS